MTPTTRPTSTPGAAASTGRRARVTRRRARLAVKRATRIEWPWEGAPTYRLHGWASTVALDPVPGYAHDMELVRETLAAVDRAWGHEGPVTYHLASLEGACRTNALTSSQYGKGGKVVAHHVFLSGKRIPPHPAMTRYLVAHEYGHCVDDWISHRLGISEDAILDEYAKVRGLDGPRRSSPGTWHRATAEVFACDFRVVVAGVEPEYWPHQGVPRPTRRAIVRWWQRNAP